MGEEKEKKKKKKKKEDKKHDESPPPAPVEEEKKASKKSSKKSSKRASGAAQGSGPLSIFNERQLEDFKNGFNYMDQDKDGIITKGDLFRTYDIIGKLAGDAELDALLNESENPITFTQMLSMFAEKAGGKADDDDLIIESIKAFDEGDGTIDDEQFAAMMRGKGDPLSQKEIDEVFPDLPRCDVKPHPRYLSLNGFIELIVAKPEEEDEEEEEEVAPA